MTVSFRAKLLATHALIALAVGAVTLLVVERLVSQRLEQQLDARLEAQARAVAQWMERAAHPQQLARRLSGVVDARVTIIDKNGVALGESTAPANARPAMDAEGVTQEVVDAREGNVGRQTRFSTLDNRHVRYVAVEAPDDMVVRLGVPTTEIDEIKSQLRRQLLIAAIASLLVALALAAAIAGPLTRRLRDATALARRIGAGDYDLPKPSDARDEIGLLSRSLASAGTELRATEQRRREFLANVAHEIRTPVTSIRGYAELLAKGNVDADTSREFHQTIHRNAKRIGQLVEDLLELEAIAAGKGPELDDEPVALSAVVAHVVDTLRAAADRTGSTIAVEVPDISARGDADAIERIVLNLVENALRHGGSGIRVEISAKKTADRATLTVTDTGPGVPEEHRARIFDRLYRVKATEGGSGLGLAIASELAHSMKGSLTLAASSTFRLELPA